MSKWDKETAEWYAERYGEYPTNRLLGPAHRHYQHTRHPQLDWGSTGIPIAARPCYHPGGYPIKLGMTDARI